MYGETKCKDVLKRILEQDNINKDEDDDILDARPSSLYNITSVDEDTLEYTYIGEATDPYELLNLASKSSDLPSWNSVLLITYGWAAPFTDEDIPPSKNPERIRVVLSCIVHRESLKIETVICMMENLDSNEFSHVEYDTNGKGQLADALQKLFDPFKSAMKNIPKLKEMSNENFFI